jgi:uncharacterized membrane protein YfcA
MLGMASGIFIVPILTMLCHIDLGNAIGASIVSVTDLPGSLPLCSPLSSQAS